MIKATRRSEASSVLIITTYRLRRLRRNSRTFGRVVHVSTVFSKARALRTIPKRSSSTKSVRDRFFRLGHWMVFPRKHESRLKNVPSKSPYTLPGPRPGNTPPHRRRASLSSRPASRRPSREMIQKSFHRIFTRSRAFTRRPRRPRRQLPRFSSLVLHVVAPGDVPDHDSRPRSFVRSRVRRVKPRGRIHGSRVRSPPRSTVRPRARARVCHPPRPGTRAPFPSNPAPRPVAGARRSLFPEISRRFFALYRTLSREHAIRVEIFYVRVSSRAHWLTVCA